MRATVLVIVSLASACGAARTSGPSDGTHGGEQHGGQQPGGQQQGVVVGVTDRGAIEAAVPAWAASADR